MKRTVDISELEDFLREMVYKWSEASEKGRNFSTSQILMEFKIFIEDAKGK